MLCIVISLDKLQSKSYYQRKRKNDDNSFDIPFQRRAAIGSAQRVRTSKARNKNDKRNLIIRDAKKQVHYLGWWLWHSW